MFEDISEQFTVKAHPALFEGEGDGEGARKNWGTLSFQSTIDIHSITRAGPSYLQELCVLSSVNSVRDLRSSG